MNYRVVKEDDLFFLTDEKGNIPLNHSYGAGLYTKDTRFLSKFELQINKREPILLASKADDPHVATMLLTNPHMEENGELVLWRESVELERKRFISNGVCYEAITVRNYYPKPVSFELSLHVDADFQDMFIVRGFQNGEVGKRTGVLTSSRDIRFIYEGKDGIKRETLISWNREAKTVEEKGDIYFDLSLAHGEKKEIVLAISPILNQEEPKVFEVTKALSMLKQTHTDWLEKSTHVQTDNQQLQRLVDRGLSDMRVLLTDLGYGAFPVAGLPWFAVPFGRDSLIAALQLLPFNAEVAKGTLKTMAAYQGTKVDPWRDEQPGKIMHELRAGELAQTNQIPFTPYYGTVDATPLFLILLSEYVNWTGDVSLFDDLLENVEAALVWIDKYGDCDGDGFVEYHQESAKGIANQGWKDSGDSIVHRNGDYAETPIALAEVQGYIYQSKTALAEIFETKGETARAKTLRVEAAVLQERFEKAFWMEEEQFYAIALDKDKQQVGTLTTNPGHVLFSQMLSSERAKRVSEVLVSKKMFSGYGIRTMGEGEAGYNPMSYHDGSVWPHDNSMVLLGMGKLGHKSEANKVITGLLKASRFFEYDRLPELFCGYTSDRGVVPYPVACSPQAWAAGTPLVFIQAMLGLYPNHKRKQIQLIPSLPDDIQTIHLSNISIGTGVLEVVVQKVGGKTEYEVKKNTTGYSIVNSGVKRDSSLTI